MPKPDMGYLKEAGYAGHPWRLLCLELCYNEFLGD